MSHNRKPRLLLVVNYFAPYVSGVTVYANALAESLSPSTDVTVLCGRHDSRLPLYETSGNLRIVRAEILARLDKGYVSHEFVRKFRELAAASDVVNLHFPMLEAGLLSKIAGVPTILTYQCDMAYKGSILSRLALGAVRVSGIIALKNADRIVVLNRDYAQSSPLLRKHFEKIVAIPPPNRFWREANSNLPETNGNTRNGEAEITIGFVGRFVEEKGLDVLLHAMSIIGRHKLLLVGPHEGVAGGSIIGKLRKTISSLGSRVELLGAASDSELMSFYKKIDVIVLPSTNRFEAFGMVQLEAMGFGAFPVASDLAGVREVIRKTGIGLLAAPGNSPDLARCLEAAARELSRLPRRLIAETALRTMGGPEWHRPYHNLIRQLRERI